MRPFLILAFFLAAGPSHALSAEPPKRIELLFGPEEEFRNKKIVGYARKKILKMSELKFQLKSLLKNRRLYWTDEKQKLIYDESMVVDELKKFADQVKASCATWKDLQCSYLILDHTPYVVAPGENGEDLFFMLTPDRGVMEINSSPIRLRELRGRYGELYGRLQAEMKKSGWKQAGIGGEGHVHVDLRSAFGAGEKKMDLRRFRNFFVDWMNHNELYWGGLHYDPKIQGAAPHITDDRSQGVVKSVIEDLDLAIQEHGAIVSESQFFDTYGQIREWYDNWFGKGHSIGLWEETFELRSIRPKQDLDEMERVYKLIEGRINYIATQEHLIPFHGGEAPRNIQEAVDRFYLYATQSGEDWKEMRKLLPAHWRVISPSKEIIEAKLFAPSIEPHFVPPKSFRCMSWIFNHVLRW